MRQPNIDQDGKRIVLSQPKKESEEKIMSRRAEMLRIGKDLKSLRTMLINYFTDFKVLAESKPALLTSYEHYIFKINVLMHIFQRIDQGDFNDHQVQHRGIDKFSREIGIESLYKYTKESEVSNLEKLEEQIRKTVTLTSQFRSDNMYRLSLGESMHIIDIVSIDQESDEKLEFNLFFKRTENSMGALFYKKISFKDFNVALNS